MRSLLLIAALVLLPGAPPIKAHRMARSASAIVEEPGVTGRALTEIGRCDRVGIVDDSQGSWIKVRFWGTDGFVPASTFNEGPALAQNGEAASDACDGDELEPAADERAPL
jgi:hypothetical protein